MNDVKLIRVALLAYWEARRIMRPALRSRSAEDLADACARHLATADQSDPERALAEFEASITGEAVTAILSSIPSRK